MNKITKDRLIKVLEDTGVYIDPTEEEDINLTNYVNDSIHFISIIVAIETEFEIEVSDELIIFDTFTSLNHVVEIINKLITPTFSN